MDLSKPCYEISKEYDTKIFDLQKDIEELEKQFGFQKDQLLIQQSTQLIDGKTKKKVTINQGTAKRRGEQEAEEDEQPQLLRPTPIPMNNSTKYLNQTSKQSRYTNLISIKQEQPKMVKKNPEISEKWPEVFAQKPAIMRFYNKEEFDPIDFNKRDFQTNIHLQKENDVFNEYMDTFALTNL